MALVPSLPLGIIPFIDIGAWEWVIIGIIAVLLFGNRLPDLGRSLGKGLVSFRKGVNEMKDEITKAASEDITEKEDETPAPQGGCEGEPEQAESDKQDGQDKA